MGELFFTKVMGLGVICTAFLFEEILLYKVLWTFGNSNSGLLLLGNCSGGSWNQRMVVAIKNDI